MSSVAICLEKIRKYFCFYFYLSSFLESYFYFYSYFILQNTFTFTQVVLRAITFTFTQVLKHVTRLNGFLAGEMHARTCSWSSTNGRSDIQCEISQSSEQAGDSDVFDARSMPNLSQNIETQHLFNFYADAIVVSGGFVTR